MGFVTDTIRLFYLTQLKSDLSHKIRLINEAKLDMERSVTSLMDVGTDLDPDSPIIKNMKARRDKMELVERELNQKLTLYQSKLAAVEEEIKEVRGLVKNDAQTEFKYGL